MTARFAKRVVVVKIFLTICFFHIVFFLSVFCDYCSVFSVSFFKVLIKGGPADRARWAWLRESVPLTSIDGGPRLARCDELSNTRRKRQALLPKATAEP